MANDAHYPEGSDNKNAPWNKVQEFDETKGKFECEDCGEYEQVDQEMGLCEYCFAKAVK